MDRYRIILNPETIGETPYRFHYGIMAKDIDLSYTTYHLMNGEPKYDIRVRFTLINGTRDSLGLQYIYNIEIIDILTCHCYNFAPFGTDVGRRLLHKYFQRKLYDGNKGMV